MGYCSYPRTESTAYGAHFDIKGTLQRQSGHNVWGDYASNLLRVGYTRPRAGTDVGDHPPITPVRGASPADLGGDMGRLYDLIVRHFLATVSPDCEYETTTATVGVGEERFHTAGERVIEPGFKALYPAAASEASRPPPLFHEGDRLPVTVVVREGLTSPPCAQPPLVPPPHRTAPTRLPRVLHPAPSTPLRSLDSVPCRARAHHAHGEARHWHRCQHPHPH